MTCIRQESLKNRPVRALLRENYMTCKGICIRHKAQKPVGSGRYASGQKRCQICEIFIKWDGLWCPCCGYRLRTKPRNLKYKAKLRAKTVKVEVANRKSARRLQQMGLKARTIAQIPKRNNIISPKIKPSQRKGSLQRDTS